MITSREKSYFFKTFRDPFIGYHETLYKLNERTFLKLSVNMPIVGFM